MALKKELPILGRLLFGLPLLVFLELLPDSVVWTALEVSTLGGGRLAAAALAADWDDVIWTLWDTISYLLKGKKLQHTDDEYV